MRSENEQDQSLTQQAHRRLREDISYGFFAPAARLNIESLKRRYEMGGTPIREALNQLVESQWVDVLPLKGFRVSAISIEDANDILATREWVEKNLLLQAREHGDDYWESMVLGGAHRLKKACFSDAFYSSVDYIAGLQAVALFDAGVCCGPFKAFTAVSGDARLT